MPWQMARNCGERVVLKVFQGFSSGSVVKNPAANAGRQEFDPCSGKTPQAVEQPSSGTASAKPVL